MAQDATRLVAFVAALGLAILPHGVMPHVGAGGALELVLCSVDGPVTMVVDTMTGETSRKMPSGSAKPACDWATVQSTATVVAEAPAVTPPQTLEHRAAPAMETAVWRPAHDPRGLYARGPPALV